MGSASRSAPFCPHPGLQKALVLEPRSCGSGTMLIDEAGNEIGHPRHSTGAAVPGNAKYRRRKLSVIQPRSAL
jgi:hypothetical protein